MARRSFAVRDIAEILEHWHRGRSIQSVAKSLGVDRKTVKKYADLAKAAGFKHHHRRAVRKAIREAGITSRAAKGQSLFVGTSSNLQISLVCARLPPWSIISTQRRHRSWTQLESPRKSSDLLPIGLSPEE